MREEQTAHSCQLLVQEHLLITVFVKHPPTQGFPSLSLSWSFHISHILFFFYLGFNSVEFGRPLTCCFVFSNHQRILLRVVVTLCKVNLWLIEGGEVLEGILFIILKFIKIYFLFLIHQLQHKYQRLIKTYHINSPFRQAGWRPSHEESLWLFPWSTYICTV